MRQLFLAGSIEQSIPNMPTTTQVLSIPALLPELSLKRDVSTSYSRTETNTPIANNAGAKGQKGDAGSGLKGDTGVKGSKGDVGPSVGQKSEPGAAGTNGTNGDKGANPKNCVSII